ncbi:MAG: serine/threonine-protein kinase, partial [Gemmatimonadaceae bacterium]
MDATAPEPDDAPRDTGDDEPADFGRLADDYVFVQRLARGGLAVVDLARDRRSGRHVAIKRVHASFADDPETVTRFAREAGIVATLDHPSIVRTLAVKQPDDHTLAIVMQYVPWPTLRSVLARVGPFPIERARRVLAEMGAALRYAHERGIVHRDVKPENIFLHERSARSLLSDFGSARPIRGPEHNVTLNGSAIGTPTYMSPEQIDGLAVDGRSDLYSLGLVGWELLTGERPWEGESLYRVLYNQKHERLPSLAMLRADVPASLLFAVEGLLPKDRAARWPDAGAFLDQLLREEPTVHPVTGPSVADAPGAAGAAGAAGAWETAADNDGDDELDDAAWARGRASDVHAPTVRIATTSAARAPAGRPIGRGGRRGLLTAALVVASLAVVGGLHQSRARATADRVRAMDSLVASIRGGELADRAADPVP